MARPHDEKAPVLRVSVLSRSTLFVITPALLLFALVPLSLLVWTPGKGPLPWVLLGPLVALSIVLLAREALTHVEVGRDGVLLRRGGWRRFMPFTTIRSIEDRGLDLRFSLTSGDELVVRTFKEEQVGKPRYVAQVELLVARIAEEVEARSGADGKDGDGTRTPGGGALLAHARSLLGHDMTGAPGYRAQALPPVEELWRIVDDPDADETARAAAAVTLRREPDAKVRLRVCSDETASPHLRKLLRVAADDEADRKIETALDACARAAR